MSPRRVLRKIAPIVLASTMGLAVANTGQEAKAGAPWSLHDSEGSTTIYTTKKPGHQTPTVKTVSEIDAPTDQVWRYIQRNPKRLTPNVAEVQVLGSCGTNCKYLYQRIHRPPIEDRHYVLESRWSRRGEPGHYTYTRRTNATNKVRPPKSGPIMVDQISGEWTLEPLDDGRRTRLTRVTHMEIGGDVPARVFNRGFIKAAGNYAAIIERAFSG